MKIGIITYHFARNYGAILQCYALQEQLRSMGHDVWVLNYRNVRQERNNSLHHKRDSFLINLAVNVALLPFEAKRRSKERKFDEYEKSHLCLTPRFYTVEELRDYVNAKKIDLLISGSDQVFNPNIPDFDEVFFFPFETAALKASFAASLGSATKAELSSFSDALASFDVLCVRENTDAPIVKEVCGRSPEVADDPVFLLDSNRWAKAANTKVEDRGYVLGYYINKEASSRYLDLTRMVASKLGLPLKVINVRFGCDSFRPEMITDAGPNDFLELFAGASFVCTDSFHGTAYSLIFGKRFVSFEPKSNSTDFRKRDLLNKVGESWRSVAVDSDSAENFVVGLCKCPASAAQDGISLVRDAQLAFIERITRER